MTPKVFQWYADKTLNNGGIMYGIIDHVTKPGDRITVALFNGMFVKLDVTNKDRQARNLILGALVWCEDSKLKGLVCVDTRDCAVVKKEKDYEGKWELMPDGTERKCYE